MTDNTPVEPSAFDRWYDAEQEANVHFHAEVTLCGEMSVPPWASKEDAVEHVMDILSTMDIADYVADVSAVKGGPDMLILSVAPIDDMSYSWDDLDEG